MKILIIKPKTITLVELKDALPGGCLDPERAIIELSTEKKKEKQFKQEKFQAIKSLSLA